MLLPFAVRLRPDGRGVPYQEPEPRKPDEVDP